MNIVLLAAGRSTRMDPISDKNFLSFCGKQLIAHQIEVLRHVFGSVKVLLVGGEHNREKLSAVATGYENVEVIEQEHLELGMAGALLSAQKHLQDQPFLVVSSNDIVEVAAFELIKKFVQNDPGGSALVGYQVKNYFPGGYLTVQDGVIRSIVEKPGEGNEPSDLINLVIHFHAKTQPFFEALEQISSPRDDRYERALDALFSSGHRYHALPFDGYWQAIKYPWHILQAREYFLSQVRRSISPEASVASTAVINGEVVIEPGARVLDHATIQGPCYIGRDTIVANNALVRGSIVGERCVVGYSTEIARSFLGDDVWTHSNYIGDSIIDSNVSFGAGSVTGNLRLDEEPITVQIQDKPVSAGTNKFGLICGPGVRCGINVSFMPGVKVGKGSFMGAGLTVAEDIPDGSYVTGEWKLKVTPNRKRAAPRQAMS